jgi:curved DNA-binding protein CbpA
VSTHYDVLGVAPDAGVEQIRAAYLRLARRHHPDHPGGSAEAMQAVNVAWQVLRDPVRRRAYDVEIGRPDPRDVFVEDRPFEDDEPGQWVDDTPLSRAGQRGPLLALLPPLLVVAAVGLFSLGVMLGALALIALAGAALVAAAAMFVLVPLVAMGDARRDEGR